MTDNPYAPPLAEVADIPNAFRSTLAPFHAVSVVKLGVLGFCTMGIYGIFWFYFHWKRIKVREGDNSIPVMRALFAIFFCNKLFRRVRDAGDELDITPSLASGPLAAGWIILNLAVRLPEPYWLVSIFAFAFLLPVQAHANKVNAAVAPGQDTNERFTPGNWVLVVLGSILVLLSIIGIFLPGPGH